MGHPASTGVFAEVQNKLLYAATEQTAAELIDARADANQAKDEASGLISAG